MTIELFGTARDLVRRGAVDVTIDEPAPLREVLRALARAYPVLVGTVLDATTAEPISPNLILLDGRRAAALGDPIVASDLPCLLVLPSGG